MIRDLGYSGTPRMTGKPAAAAGSEQQQAIG